MLDKNAEDLLDRSREEWSIINSEEGKEHPAYNKTKEG
jgi:hypothetical protein